MKTDIAVIDKSEQDRIKLCGDLQKQVDRFKHDGYKASGRTAETRSYRGGAWTISMEDFRDSVDSSKNYTKCNEYDEYEYDYVDEDDLMESNPSCALFFKQYGYIPDGSMSYMSRTPLFDTAYSLGSYTLYWDERGDMMAEFQSDNYAEPIIGTPAESAITAHEMLKLLKSAKTIAEKRAGKVAGVIAGSATVE